MTGTELSGVVSQGAATRRWLPVGWTIRGTLYVGFSLVFVLWLASGLDLARRVALVEERTSALSARSAAADQQLSTVRVRVLVASVYLRDALLDVRPNAGGYYRDQLGQSRTAIDQALKAYVPVAPLPAERESIEQLRSEVDAFWAMVLPVFELDVASHASEVRNLLRDQVIPKRQIILQISDRIQDLDRRAVAREQEEIHRLYAGMRRQVLVTSGMALVAGLVVAWVVTRSAGRLEWRIQEQLLKDAANTRDLQRLSAKLVSAQEDERRTIARELHDEVGQALTAIKVELSIAGKRAALTEREGAAFQEARRLTDRGLQVVRDLSQLLHPAMLDDLGLPEAIAWYLDGFSARTGIRADLVQDRMDERLAVEIETCLYRIVQEALTNVARHAEARHCRVYVQRLAHTVLLTVEDDGKGFPADQPGAAGRKRGLGLLGIEERVSGFRGSLRIETAPGEGTRLTVELPALPRQERPEPAGPDPEARASRSEEKT
jgi:signal transduction histidine kinase